MKHRAHIAAFALVIASTALPACGSLPYTECPGSPDGTRGGAIQVDLDLMVSDELHADGDPVDWKSFAIPERALYEFTVLVDTPGARPTAEVYSRYGEPVGTLEWTGPHELRIVLELKQGYWFMVTTIDRGASEYRVRARQLAPDGTVVPKSPRPQLEPVPWSERRG